MVKKWEQQETKNSSNSKDEGYVFVYMENFVKTILLKKNYLSISKPGFIEV